MLVNISACGNVSCWVYSNENISGELLSFYLRYHKQFILKLNGKVSYLIG